MKTFCIILSVIAAATTLGCQQEKSESPPPFQERQAMNRWAIQGYTDQSINNAIIAQHTVFPYHFAADSAELTELGKRDLDVLASHFKDYPGQLNVSQGATSDLLYQQRLAAVQDALVQAGVDSSRMSFGDEPAGGPGMVSERCLIIMGIEPLGSAVSSEPREITSYMPKGQ
jgi:hypothetical protein